MCRYIYCIACVFLRLSLSNPTNHMNVADKSCPLRSTVELTVTSEGQGLIYSTKKMSDAKDWLFLGYNYTTTNAIMCESNFK